MCQDGAPQFDFWHSFPAIAPAAWGYCAFADTGYMSTVDGSEFDAYRVDPFGALELELLNASSYPPPQQIVLPIHPLRFQRDQVVTLAKTVTCDYIFLPGARTHGIIFAEQTLDRFSAFLSSAISTDNALVLLVESPPDNDALIVASNVLGQVQTNCSNVTTCRVALGNVSQISLQEVATLVSAYTVPIPTDGLFYIRSRAWDVSLGVYTRTGLNDTMLGGLSWTLIVITPAQTPPLVIVIALCVGAYVLVSLFMFGLHKLVVFLLHRTVPAQYNSITELEAADLNINLNEEDVEDL
jgi:hypothetical protein